jgi:hypothetical protein
LLIDTEREKHLIDRSTESIPVLRIAIDPEISRLHAPEIHWAWRLLLSTCGWGWHEVSPGEACDVAWVSCPEDAPSAKLVILANPSAWSQPAQRRLAGLNRKNGFISPVFEGEHETDNPETYENGRIIFRRDLLFDVFWLATGQEEPYYPKERHGFNQLEATVFHRERVSILAVVGQISSWFETTVLKLGYPKPVARWPDAKKAALAVGHDVDYPEVIRWIEPLRKVKQLGAAGIRPAIEVLIGQRTHWHFRDWVSLEKSLGLRTAFFFVPRKGSLFEYATSIPDTFYDITNKKFRQLFSYLRDEGFEIGMHASYLAYQDQDLFKREKLLLEEMSQGQVSGNRHHYWHMNPTHPEETLLIHEQLGFEYDSSMIHDHYLGWRRGLSHPFFPFHPQLRRELKTLQLSPAWMDDQLFQFHANNQIRSGRVETLKVLAERVAEQGGCMTLDVHDYVFDEKLFPEWRKTYQDLLVYLSERGDFWFNTPIAIARHWTARYCKIVNGSLGLSQGLAD